MAAEPEITFRGVRVPRYNQGQAWASETAQQWRNGVLAALDSLDVGEGEARREVQAFVAVVNDDPDTARRLVADLSARDRAVLSFWLTELSDIVGQTEYARRVDADKRTRELLRRTAEADTDSNPLEGVLSLGQTYPDTPGTVG